MHSACTNLDTCCSVRNAAQTFQRFIDDEVLCDFDFCYAYIDDIFIALVSTEEHQEHLKKIFEKL